MSRITAILRSLLFVITAAALAVSAAAAGAHRATHGPDVASVDAGRIPPRQTREGQAPDQDKQDGGHDHLLGLSFPVASLAGEIRLEHPPLLAAELPAIEVKKLVLRAHDPPPTDPPRTL